MVERGQLGWTVAAGMAFVIGAAACGRSEPLTGGPANPASAEAMAAPPAARQSAAPAAAVGTVASTSASGRTYVRPSKSELKTRLTSEQYEVTQEEGTERPFHNEYWNNHEPGLYVDITTGEPLFSSVDKFESGTGWPSFTRPVEKARVVQKTDTRCGRAPGMRTSATCSTTALPQRGCATASTRRRCGSSPCRSSKRKATGST